MKLVALDSGDGDKHSSDSSLPVCHTDILMSKSKYWAADVIFRLESDLLGNCCINKVYSTDLSPLTRDLTPPIRSTSTWFHLPPLLSLSDTQMRLTHLSGHVPGEEEVGQRRQKDKTGRQQEAEPPGSHPAQVLGVQLDLV